MDSYDGSHSDADIEETTEPKRGRGITTMETFWPIVENVKLKVDYNEHFQPVGPYASKLANVIGNLAKGKVLSLAYEDWTDVPNKDDVWDNVKRYFDLDECLKEYVMRSAHKKWKDFKNRLKAKYFDPEKTNKELWKKHDSRISLKVWKWLVCFWRSEKGKARSNRGKANRAKMVAVHTIGTRSLANVRHDMEKRKGRKVSRAEVFKVAYTRKDGRPQPAHEVTIAKIDEKLTEEPEFVDKPIEEGDYLSNLLGKENRGRVIGIGMGPTPASLGLPGTKSTARTILQLEREARHRAEEEVRALK
ncbi:uncharacterized protein [Oryza sativa Japonica Group]|uniref:uncharacterized protein n=1 Tax=Oryza sativa subsp. japonica TaxID=39947 RepID=UPI00339BFAC4